MIDLRKLAAGCLVLGAAPALAGESLINGQPLEYNRAYRCNGERIIVAHCRDNDDSSYCQTVYPDRPFQNGMQVAPVEMRGDVVAKLNACGKVASAPAAPKASAPPGVKTAYAGKPPGVGKAGWAMLDFDERSATFFTRANIKHSGNLAEGWFTIVYVKPKDIPGTPLTGIQYNQTRYLANCAKGTDRLAEAAYLGEDGKIISGSMIGEDLSPVVPTNKGSVRWEQWNVLCGKPQETVNQLPLEGRGDLLIYYYHYILKEQGLE
jgi:hypothetical protein